MKKKKTGLFSRFRTTRYKDGEDDALLTKNRKSKSNLETVELSDQSYFDNLNASELLGS